MIEQYSITASAEKVSDRFGAEILGVYQPFYNASPTLVLPVITSNSPQGVSNFYWGTLPEWSKNKQVSEKILHTRADMIVEKGSLRKALMKSRCIILADGFYGWKKTGKKTRVPYRFVCRNQELFSFAGLWEEYEDTDGREHHTFSIITVASNSLVSPVEERMPVILDRKAEIIWLNKESRENTLLDILQTYPAENMDHYPVSPRISDKTVNVPSLIIATPPSDQFGNLTLFD